CRGVAEGWRVTIGRWALRGLGGDLGGCRGRVFDDELLAKPLGQPLTDQARGDVGGAAGGKADDHAHRPRRIALRPRNTRRDRQRGRARCEMQKISAGEFHGLLLFNVGDAKLYSALMFAARITLAHFSIWSAMNFPNSADVNDIG